MRETRFLVEIYFRFYNKKKEKLIQKRLLLCEVRSKTVEFYILNSHGLP